MSESKILHVRKLAGDDGQPRVKGVDETGAPTFLDPYTGRANPKPLAGVRIGSIDDPSTAPAVTGISSAMIDQGQREGWLTLVDPTPVTFPGGTKDRPWAVTHTFVQASKVIFHTVDGDVTYRVSRNPGKYTANGDEAGVDQVGDPTCEVFDDYRLTLEG